MLKKIGLFGASHLGEIAFRHLKSQYEIVCFIDNSEEKQGTLFCNRKIVNPEKMKEMTDVLIVISSTYDVEIVKQLIEMEIKEFATFTIKHDRHKLSYFDYRHIQDFSIQKNKIALLVQNHSGSNTLALSKKIPSIISGKYHIIILEKTNTSHHYYFDLITSYVVVATHDYRCDENQLNIQLWHGIPLKGISYMSQYPNQNAESNHKAWSKLNYIGTSSQTASTLLNSCYGVSGEKYKLLGYPRNDLMLEEDSRGKLERVSNMDLENKEIIFYLPTYRENVFGECNGTSEELLSHLGKDELDHLNAFLEQNKLVLFMKLHPEQQNIDQEYPFIRMIYEEDLENAAIDLYELIGASDLLITDYSSVFFDYLLLNKPLIFYTPDLEKYAKERGFLLNPIEYWLPGEMVLEQKNLVSEIIRALKKDPHKKRRNELKNIFHDYQDGCSIDRTWFFIEELLQSTS
ncbi:putative glycosyltransferase [Bacillus sp. TS-2]|nr:putative glycosyltransferase [Bacillus sp. TS-2]